MKITIITVVYNGEAYIKDCVESVISQSYRHIEYIVIDGNSSDSTLSILQQYKPHIGHLISEPDSGLYEAINKGINMARGEVVGLLNADDMLANSGVIEAVAKTFAHSADIDAVYGDLNYITPQSNKVLRRWKSRQANEIDILSGWMPAHPTLYLKRSLFERHGMYANDLGTAADYDLILRYFYTHRLDAAYLPILMVNMRAGGVSNNSLTSLFRAFLNDYKALKRNKIPLPVMVIMKKKLCKLVQFW